MSSPVGKSRKDYICARCGREIKKGEISQRFQRQGRHATYERRCKECAIETDSHPDEMRAYIKSLEPSGPYPHGHSIKETVTKVKTNE